MPIKRMIVLAMSTILLCTIFITMRGISNMPADLPSVGDMSLVDHSSSDKRSTHQVELRVVVNLPDDSFQVLQALNRTFMVRHPSITVKLTNESADGWHERLAQSFRMEDAPDLILLDNEAVMEYAIKAQLQPTDDYFTTTTQTEFLPAMIGQLSWNGYIWGVPFQVQPYILAYHAQAWYELTGEVMPSSIERVWDAYRTRQLLIYDEDPLAYAALATALDHRWQFPRDIHLENMPVDLSVDDRDHVINMLVEHNTGSSQHSFDTQHQDGAVEDVEQAMDAQLLADEDAEAQPTDSMMSSFNTDEGKQSSDLTQSGDEWDRLRRGEIVALITTLHAYEKYRTEAIVTSILPSTNRDGSLFMSGKSFVITADAVDEAAAFLWLQELTKHYNLVFESRSLGAYPATYIAYADAGIHIPSPYTSLRNAIDKGKAPSPDVYLRAKLPIVREQLKTAQVADAEVDDVMRQLSQRLVLSGLYDP